MVLAVYKDQLKVEVSLKPSDVKQTEDFWMSNRNTLQPVLEWWEQVGRENFDPYFNEDEALKAYQKNYKKKIDEATKVIFSVIPFFLKLKII